jgi:hypothetical protein
MICPLKQLAYSISAVLPTTDDCDEDDCAWWFGAQGCCSLPAIANLLELARRGNFGG